MADTPINNPSVAVEPVIPFVYYVAHYTPPTSFKCNLLVGASILTPIKLVVGSTVNIEVPAPLSKSQESIIFNLSASLLSKPILYPCVPTTYIL